jgi:hypothetical protein
MGCEGTSLWLWQRGMPGVNRLLRPFIQNNRLLVAAVAARMVTATAHLIINQLISNCAVLCGLCFFQEVKTSDAGGGAAGSSGGAQEGGEGSGGAARKRGSGAGGSGNKLVVRDDAATLKEVRGAGGGVL